MIQIKDKSIKAKKKAEKVAEVCDNIENIYDKKCNNNVQLLETEEKNREELLQDSDTKGFLYPHLDDPNFNIKIALKKEFNDTRYDGTIYDIKEYADLLSKAEYELSPHQAFVRNFMSFQTPYNSLLLYHGLGSGKTCAAIGVCEEMRDYLRQMGISKQIIIVASPNVQDNFRLQLFDERKLKEVDGIWTMKGCLGNKLLKEINPTGMKGLKKDKIIQQIKQLINTSYYFVGYVQFSNDIVRKSGGQNLTKEEQIRNLQMAYSDNLVVIDEVHNIRIADDNENKNVAKNLMYLVSVVNNMRLLLLSATPMFNNYKEIVWLLNLMNMNDKRGIISISDIFDKNGEFREGNEEKGIISGREMLIRKATGYISYVRGENPYTFPFRVYPNKFAPEATFKTKEEYPIYQLNRRKIPDDRKIEKLSIFLTVIGEYQEMGYRYIINRMLSRQETIKETKIGTTRRVPSFLSQKAFGYMDLQIPLGALNIVYPLNEGELEALTKDIKPFTFREEYEEDETDLSPKSTEEEVDIVEEIDEVFDKGPTITHISNETKKTNSEIESEFGVTEGIDAEPNLFDNVVELDTTKVAKLVPKQQQMQQEQQSFSASIVKPNKKTLEHIIEGPTKSNKLSSTSSSSSSTPSSSSSTPSTSSSNSSLSSASLSSSSSGGAKKRDKLLISPKDLTGADGLRRIMDYRDEKTPAFKGDFEYKQNVPHMFNQDQIGKYSAKIKAVCESIYNSQTNTVSDGIIIIYSAYLDAGLIPMALALESMGFTRFGKNAKPLFKNLQTPIVDVRTMRPPENRKDFKPAMYSMITGDPRLSPNNDFEMKTITNQDNISLKMGDNICGQNVKVVLISQAGSEGLDFKAVRQIHILEPWYNVNRTEQIIGRGVRNFSHKDLPFEKRNVQIFLYGTMLKNAQEEAADLYVYRISEIKAVKIGKVTRLLKETSVDCIINHDQSQFTPENFDKVPENQNITQILSTQDKLENFEIGDLPNSATCDYMDTCEYKCLPNIDTNDEKLLNYETYNETFMLINSDKIIQKVKGLFRMRFFYKKRELLQLINIPKSYPLVQIYAALTQMINDNSEYITDKYGRTGYLNNIGDYYLFQPSELNYDNISVYERSVPLDFKHNSIKFEIKGDVSKPVIDKRGLEKIVYKGEDVIGKEILIDMYNNYKTALHTTSVEKGSKNWYQYCGLVIRKMKETGIELAKLEIFLIEHIVDSLMMNERIQVLNYLYTSKNIDIAMPGDQIFKHLMVKVKSYLMTKIVMGKNITGMVIFNGPSRIDNLHIFVLNNLSWVPAEPEDKLKLQDSILQKYRIKTNLNNYVGFIGFESNYMVYKIKDTTNNRSTGFRCDQAGKKKTQDILKAIENAGLDETEEDTKQTAFELCVKQEFILRNYEYENKKVNGKDTTWFVDTETAIINEFEKKEKKK